MLHLKDRVIHITADVQSRVPPTPALEMGRSDAKLLAFKTVAIRSKDALTFFSPGWLTIKVCNKNHGTNHLDICLIANKPPKLTTPTPRVYLARMKCLPTVV
jgi:hypothetical protein